MCCVEKINDLSFFLSFLLSDELRRVLGQPSSSPTHYKLVRTYETPPPPPSTTQPEGEDAVHTATTPSSSSSRSRFSPLTAAGSSSRTAGISRPTKLRVFRREAFDAAMLEEMTKAAHEFDFADELLLHDSNSSSSQQQLADEIARGAAMLTALEQLAASPAAAARPRFRREAFDSTMLAEMGKAAEEFDFADQLPAAQHGKAAAESLKKSGNKAGQSQTKPPNHAGQFASHLKQVEELMASMMSMGGHSSGAQQHASMPMHPHLAASGLRQSSPSLGGQPSSGAATSQPSFGGQFFSSSTSSQSSSSSGQSASGSQSSSSGGQYSSSGGGHQPSSGGQYHSSAGQYSPRVVHPNAGQSSSPRGEYLYHSSGIQYTDGKKTSSGVPVLQGASGTAYSSGGPQGASGTAYSSGGPQGASGTAYSSGGGPQGASGTAYASGGPQGPSGTAYSSGGPQGASGTAYSSGGPQGASGPAYSSGGDSDDASAAAAGLQATVRKLQRREVGSDFATTQSLEELQQAVEEVDLVDAVLEAGGGSADPGLDSTSVADPDPSDPYVFGPPGSGSGSFYHQANIVRKTLIPTVLRLLFDFFL
jgi:hypothetical protein